MPPWLFLQYFRRFFVIYRSVSRPEQPGMWWTTGTRSALQLIRTHVQTHTRVIIYNININIPQCAAPEPWPSGDVSPPRRPRLLNHLQTPLYNSLKGTLVYRWHMASAQRHKTRLLAPVLLMDGVSWFGTMRIFVCLKKRAWNSKRFVSCMQGKIISWVV